MNRTIFESDHDLFRTSVREFVEREMSPNVHRWEEEGIVDKEVFRKAGRAGMLGMAVSEQYGGGGVDDFRFNAVIVEELMRGDAMGSGLYITLHNDVVHGGIHPGPKPGEDRSSTQDTAELFFDDVRVPLENLLGEEGRGFVHLMDNLSQERLSLTVGSIAHAQTAFDWKRTK